MADQFELSRIAVMKHLAVLEDAGLVHSIREGRMRRLYADAVPIQMIYDRWTDAYSSRWARHALDIKRSVEESRCPKSKSWSGPFSRSS